MFQNGTCIATVLSELAVNIVQFNYVKKEINIKEMFKLSYRYIFAAVIMYAVCMLTKIFISTGMTSIVVEVIIGVIVYLGILLALKDEYLYMIINKVRSKILGRV